MLNKDAIERETPVQTSMELAVQANNTDNASLAQTASTLYHKAKDDNKNQIRKGVDEYVVSFILPHAQRRECMICIMYWYMYGPPHDTVEPAADILKDYIDRNRIRKLMRHWKSCKTSDTQKSKK